MRARGMAICAGTLPGEPLHGFRFHVEHSLLPSEKAAFADALRKFGFKPAAVGCVKVGKHRNRETLRRGRGWSTPGVPLNAGIAIFLVSSGCRRLQRARRLAYGLGRRARILKQPESLSWAAPNW